MRHRIILKPHKVFFLYNGGRWIKKIEHILCMKYIHYTKMTTCKPNPNDGEPTLMRRHIADTNSEEVVKNSKRLLKIIKHTGIQEV
jgi:hypothetical protein